jgi:hypothetical protein
MSTGVLAIAAAAAVACPAPTLWQMRRGRRPSCASATRGRDDVAALRRRQHDLEARIAELSDENGDEQRSYAPTARG